MVHLAKFAGLPWDCVITAENARRYKPDPDVYRTGLTLLGLEADRVMMVAAHNYDLAAAQALGLRTAFVPRPLEYGPGQTTDLVAEGKWDVVVGSVEELAARARLLKRTTAENGGEEGNPPRVPYPKEMRCPSR